MIYGFSKKLKKQRNSGETGLFLYPETAIRQDLAGIILVMRIILLTIPQYWVNDPSGWFQQGSILIRFRGSYL